jgi:hypothetical protein
MMMNNQHIRTYSELTQLSTFEERYEYLKLSGNLGVVTFGFDRYLNQLFYNSRQWKIIRNKIIIRDSGCDLGIEGRDILDGIRVHHMNPMLIEDLEYGNPDILDPEFLICCSLNTHNAIHFGNKSNLIQLPRERRKGDTTLWGQF